MTGDFEAVEATLDQISLAYNLDAEIKVTEDHAKCEWESDKGVKKLYLGPSEDGYLEVDSYELLEGGARPLKSGEAPSSEDRLYNVLKNEYMPDIVEG